MGPARDAIDPRRIAVNVGLGVMAALVGAFLVATWRALASGAAAVTEIVFTVAVVFVATLFFLSSVDSTDRGDTLGSIAVGGGLLGGGLALLAPPAWSHLGVIQLLIYPFVLLWILALVATGE